MSPNFLILSMNLKVISKPEEKSSDPPASSSDSEEEEEWERHERLHDDVTSQERTKERLYEEDLEVVWEKGGSGLVFYTDAVYWDKVAGDFDEKTADDWDVDTFGVTMDGKAFQEMQHETAMRAGHVEHSVFGGKPDKHIVETFGSIEGKGPPA